MNGYYLYFHLFTHILNNNQCHEQVNTTTLAQFASKKQDSNTMILKIILTLYKSIGLHKKVDQLFLFLIRITVCLLLFVFGLFLFT